MQGGGQDVETDPVKRQFRESDPVRRKVGDLAKEGNLTHRGGKEGSAVTV